MVAGGDNGRRDVKLAISAGPEHKPRFMRSLPNIGDYGHGIKRAHFFRWGGNDFCNPRRRIWRRAVDGKFSSEGADKLPGEGQSGTVHTCQSDSFDNNRSSSATPGSAAGGGSGTGTSA